MIIQLSFGIKNIPNKLELYTKSIGDSGELTGNII